MRLLFSYSHTDEDYRDELEKHLSTLKREGIIETWHDRRIGAGKELDSEISVHLESSEIILLLVSSNFLASDYCYEIEMQRAMEKHESGEARVIPVIVHPCDWKSAPFGKLRATPRDGKAISTFTNAHEAFLDVATDIRRAATELQPRTDMTRRRSDRLSEQPGVPRSSREHLRIRREFTDRDRDDFMDASYTYIAEYFESSLRTLEDQNDGVETRFKVIDATQFTSAIYVAGKKRAGCRIRNGGRSNSGGGITYSTSDTLGENSFNESLSVTDNGQSLLLKPLGLASFGRMREEELTQEWAAEYLWTTFIEPLQ